MKRTIHSLYFYRKYFLALRVAAIHLSDGNVCLFNLTPFAFLIPILIMLGFFTSYYCCLFLCDVVLLINQFLHMYCTVHDLSEKLCH